jgi:hypothetical protein
MCGKPEESQVRPAVRPCTERSPTSAECPQVRGSRAYRPAVRYNIVVKGGPPPDLPRRLAEAHAEAIVRRPRPQREACEELPRLIQ